MRSRAGVEIAINTVVIIILGIVILGLGLLLIRAIVTGGTEYSDQLSSSVKQQLRDQLRQGQLVAVYPGNQVIEGNERAYTGIAVENRLQRDATLTFSIQAFDEQEQPIPRGWYEFLLSERIAEGDVQEFQVVFAPPDLAEPGVYTFIVGFTDENSNPYGGKRSFTVTLR